MKTYKRCGQKRVALAALVILLFTLFAVVASAASYTPKAWTTSNMTEVDTPNTTYSLFESGQRGSYGNYYNYSYNYVENSKNNGGYDLYASYSRINKIVLGLGFTMKHSATEKVQLTIYAYDVDEESSERDCIRLVDETAKTAYTLTNTAGKDYLSGRDETWSTTTFDIAPSLLIEGHEYHFELEETVSGWVVYVRTVDLQINGLDTIVEPPMPTGLKDASITASIDRYGKVTANLTAEAYELETFNIEYKAEIGGNQNGLASAALKIPAAPTTFTQTFSLESGYPQGVYTIRAYIRHADGTLAKEVSCTAGTPNCSAVSYNANGGSNNLPTDLTPYLSGETVTVKFDYVPSRSGYHFLGWSTDKNATVPTYTVSGTKTFMIGSDDVTLYAVWKEGRAPGLYKPGTNTMLYAWDSLVSSGKIVVSGSTIVSYNAEALGDAAFGGDLVISDTITHIAPKAFLYFATLTGVEIPGSVIDIGEAAFGFCQALTYVKFLNGANALAIGDAAFAACNGLTDFTIPARVNYMVVNPWLFCTSLKSVSVDADNTNFHVVNNCVIDKAKGRIIAGFAGASIPNDGSIRWISALAFAARADIFTMTIPASMERIDANPFVGCVMLRSLTVAEGNTNFHTVNNCLIEKSTGTLISANALSVIPTDGSVKIIGDGAFAFALGATKISIPSSVTKIGMAAFVMCEQLTTLELPGNLSSIGTYALANTGALSDIYFASTEKVWNNVEKGENWDLNAGAYTMHFKAEHVHVWSEGEVIREATCTTAGEIKYTCLSEACPVKTKTDIIPALKHDLKTVVEREATCTEDGILADTCQREGCDYVKRTYVKGGHDYKLDETKQPTCTENGYYKYECDKCHHVYREPIKACHNYVESDRVNPTTEATGSITYTCTKCGDSYKIELPILIPVEKNSSVLLVQDTLPWAEDVNTMLLVELQKRGTVSSYNIVRSSALPDIDLAQYGTVMIANDQTTAMYRNLKAVSEILSAYAMGGGVLIFGACDNGWGGCGELDFALPGGVTSANYYSVHNYIVDDAHPVVTGVLTDGRSLVDDLLKGNYCSHTYFNASTLPEGANTILRDGRGNPTLVEYTLGDGVVIASGLTWEYFYVRTHFGMTDNYSKNAFDDLLTYAVDLASDNGCEHIYSEGNVVDPTCETNGYTYHICLYCDRMLISDVVPALGHKMGAWSITKAPTCCVEGVRARSCEVCGYEETVAVAAKGHTYGAGTVTKEATCTSYGEMTYVCVDCSNEKIEYIPMIGHDYECAYVKEATCETDGYMMMICKNCKAEKNVVLEKTGHYYGDDNICDECGAAGAHKHVMDGGTVVKATCQSYGYTEYRCTVSGCTYAYRNDYVEQSIHAWDCGDILEYRTCTEDGLMVYTCTECYVQRTEIVAAGHDYSETVVTEATCTENGEMVKTCKACGYAIREIIPASHTWNAGTEELAPTCVLDGVKHSVCTVCGEEATLSVPALGHEYVDGVCVRCGEKFINHVSPSKHPVYGMFFEVEDVVSGYGSELVDEYGVFLDHNEDAKFDKVGIYLTQEGRLWRRCIAATGEDVEYATYVPYLSYGGDLKYSGLTSDYINIFNLKENKYGIWNYSNYATIGANLEDANGNLLLSLYDIGQAGKQTRIFDDLDEMIAWLMEPSATMTLVGDECKSGETVTVDFEFSGDTKIQSLGIAGLEYDATKFEFVGAEWLIDDMIMNEWNEDEDLGVMVLDAPVALGGVVFRVTFRVLEETEDGEYKVSCREVVSDECARIDVVPGIITVKNIIRGDLNEDEKVDTRDAIYCLRHILYPEYYPANQDIDFNGDGVHSADDAIYLLRHALWQTRYPLSE